MKGSVRAGDVRVDGEVRSEGYRAPAKLGRRRVDAVMHQIERGKLHKTRRSARKRMIPRGGGGAHRRVAWKLDTAAAVADSGEQIHRNEGERKGENGRGERGERGKDG